MQGGVGAFTHELGRAMVEAGQEVFVHTKQAARAGSRDTPGIDVQATVLNWNWHTPGAVEHWAKEKRLDVVNIQFQTAAFNMHPAVHLLPERLRDVSVAVTFHDLRFPYLFPKAGPLRDYVVRRLARNADLAIATDRQDEARLLEWEVRRVARIPIGSNVSNELPPSYDREKWRAELGVSNDALLIGYFGFLNTTKGGRELVETLGVLLSQDINAHLLMIGGKVGASDETNAAYGQMVEQEIAAIGATGRVHWTGFAEDAAVSGHFMASDVVALPYVDGASLRRGTLMAALAHGRAIVTTEPAAPTPELTDGPSVVTVSAPPQAAELAQAILRLWLAPNIRLSYERAALVAADRFSWHSIARSTLTEFERLTGSSA